MYVIYGTMGVFLACVFVCFCILLRGWKHCVLCVSQDRPSPVFLTSRVPYLLCVRCPAALCCVPFVPASGL